jgi:hypothetical protein
MNSKRELRLFLRAIEGEQVTTTARNVPDLESLAIEFGCQSCSAMILGDDFARNCAPNLNSTTYTDFPFLFSRFGD